MGSRKIRRWGSAGMDGREDFFWFFGNNGIMIVINGINLIFSRVSTEGFAVNPLLLVSIFVFTTDSGSS